MTINTAPSADRSLSGLNYRYIIVAASFFTLLFMWGSNYCFGIFFNPLLDEFGWTRAITSGAFSLAIIMEGIGSMVTGRIFDRYGPRIVLITCGIVFGAGFILMSQVREIWHLYLLYGIVVGLGLSGSFVGTMWAVANWFTHRRGKMMAIVVSSVGVGTMLMPPIANRLIIDTGWRNAFVLVGWGAMILIVLSAFFIKTRTSNAETLPVYETDKEKTHQPSPNPPLREALRSVRLWLICGIIMLWAVGKYAILIHITPYAIEMGLHATQAANILAVIGGATFATTIALGMSVDRFGSYRTFTVGLAVMAASLAWLLSTDSLWGLYVFAIAFSFGYSCGPVLMPSLVAEAFGLEGFGTLLGIVNLCACIGCGIGPALTGYLFDRTGNYTSAFTALAFLAVVSVLLSLVLLQLQDRLASRDAT